MWLSFTAFSPWAIFLSMFFFADCSRIMPYCRIFHSWRFFVCVVHWVALGRSQFAQWHMQTMRTALNPYWILCFECIHHLDHCLQNSNLQVNWRFSQFTICFCGKLLKTWHLLESLKPWHLVKASPMVSLRRLLVYLVSGALALSICGNLFEVNRHLWSHESPSEPVKPSHIETCRRIVELCGCWLFVVSFKVANHGFMFLYMVFNLILFPINRF